MRYILLLILLTAPVTAIYYCTPAEQVYVTQEVTTLDRVLIELGTGMDPLEFKNLNVVPEPLEPGNQLCMVDPYPTTEINLADTGATKYWHLWQLFGAIRGYTFKEFVIQNEVKDGATESVMRNPNLNNFDQYIPDGGIHFEGSFPQDYDRISGNAAILSEVHALSADPVTRIACIGCTEEFDTSQLDHYLDQTLHLDIRVIIIPKETFEAGTFTVAALGTMVFNQFYGPVQQQGDHDLIIFTFIEGRTFSMTYLRDSSTIPDEDFMDGLINEGTSHFHDGKDKSFITDDIASKLYAQY